jgi:FemAB-related protein (PEP-CTERM system-associated)
VTSQAPQVSVVIPVTSTDVEPGALVEGYGSALGVGGYSYEFVFVLDGVAGRVLDEIRELAGRWPLKVVRLQGRGLGESIALSAGVNSSEGQFIVNAPQYLQVFPEDLVQVLRALESGADFVTTWRQPRVDPWLNRLQSLLFNRVLRVLMGVPFHDLNSSLRGMRRQVLEQVSVYGDLYRFLPVLAQRQGFTVVEVKVRHREEKGRKGFYGLGVYVRRMLDILAITFLARFTEKPLRFFGMLGLIAMFLGIAMCVPPLYAKLFQDTTLMNRPIFVFGTVLAAFGVQLIGYGLVGEIVIFTQSRNLREYKFEDTLQGLASPSAAREPTNSRQSEVAPPMVRELVPGEDGRWDSFVGDHTMGTFFHLSGWRRVVEEVFGHQPHYLVVEHDGEWRGILPLFWVRSMFVGHNLVSVPYGVYGGVLAEGEEAQERLLEQAARQGQRLGAAYVELRHREGRSGDRCRSDLYLTFRKTLPGDPAEVMAGIPKRARAEVRRARDRHHLVFEENGDVDEFFQLFAMNKRRLGSPALPLKWFKALREEFGSQVALHLARDPNNLALAAVMSFCYRDTVHVYYSGSRTGSNHTGVNDFIYCRIMEWAVRQGYRTFDFGRSRRDTGPASFKKNMGFVPEPLHYDYLLLGEGAQIPQFHPGNPKLSLPRRLWSTIPGFMTRHLGGQLSRYLP